MRRLQHAANPSAAALRRSIRWIVLPAVMAAAGFMPAAVDAADPPPAVLARFTKSVQPLLLNRCATGACHGSASSPQPRLRRGIGGHVDRQLTLANLDAFLAAVGPGGDPGPLLATISSRHPASAGPTKPTAAPLSPQERATLEDWLTAAMARGNYKQATPARIADRSPQPNRFRAMLDAAVSPPQLPPPQEPPGIILGKDGEERGTVRR